MTGKKSTKNFSTRKLRPQKYQKVGESKIRSLRKLVLHQIRIVLMVLLMN